MIREVEGDILLSKAQLIAHGIAPLEHFDTGLARSLCERWPSLLRDYRQSTHVHPLKPGEIWAWGGVNEDGSVRRIVNLLTQNMLGEGPAARPGGRRPVSFRTREGGGLPPFFCKGLSGKIDTDVFQPMRVGYLY